MCFNYTHILCDNYLTKYLAINYFSLLTSEIQYSINNISHIKSIYLYKNNYIWFNEKEYYIIMYMSIKNVKF